MYYLPPGRIHPRNASAGPTDSFLGSTWVQQLQSATSRRRNLHGNLRQSTRHKPFAAASCTYSCSCRMACSPDSSRPSRRSCRLKHCVYHTVYLGRLLLRIFTDEKAAYLLQQSVKMRGNNLPRYTQDFKWQLRRPGPGEVGLQAMLQELFLPLRRFQSPLDCQNRTCRHSKLMQVQYSPELLWSGRGGGGGGVVKCSLCPVSLYLVILTCLKHSLTLPHAGGGAEKQGPGLQASAQVRGHICPHHYPGIPTSNDGRDAPQVTSSCSARGGGGGGGSFCLQAARGLFKSSLMLPAAMIST